jgi:hypothetical protein
MAKVANRNGTDFEWEIRSQGGFATPADFPHHDCSVYRGLHVRREGLGFVHRSRAIFCCPAPNPVTIRNFCTAVRSPLTCLLSGRLRTTTRMRGMSP